VLQVEQVLRVLGHRNHVGIEMGAPEVGHGLKVALTQGGECDVCCLLNSSVGLTTNDGSHPQLRRLRGIVTQVLHMSRPSTIDKR
jgi:hypothetical protein